jgi:hypothetical protein
MSGVDTGMLPAISAEHQGQHAPAQLTKLQATPLGWIFAAGIASRCSQQHAHGYAASKPGTLAPLP